jgi:hypothetical protein
LEKSPDADLLREMIGFAAQRLMEREVGGLTRAGYGEQSVERLVSAQRLSRAIRAFRECTTPCLMVSCALAGPMVIAAAAANPRLSCASNA